MSDDLLERATRALREESVPSAIDLAETRARLLSASTTKRARRTAALRWVLPLAAAFVAGSALAATQGGVERAVQAVRAVQSWLADAPVTEAPKKKAKRAVPRQEPAFPSPSAAPVSEGSAPEVLPASAPEQPAASQELMLSPEPAVAVVSERSPRRAEPRRSSEPVAIVEPEVPSREKSVPEGEGVRDERVAPEPAQATPVATPSPDLALYREAHRSHFIARDYASALSLWNAYLARFPDGIFALEARYNRAISLVRLQRTEEAEAALTPFAEGQVKGAYRRDEARALLDALRKKP